MEHKQLETREMIKDILQEDYLRLTLDSYQIEEHIDDLSSRIIARVRRSDQEQALVIEGGGVGTVHAFFLATQARFVEQFPSIKAIHFSAFSAKSVPGSDRDDPMDAEVEVRLHVCNSYKDDFEFVKRSRSLLRASLDAVLEASEYFVNSELAYIRLYHALGHHRKEGRSDQIDRYTSLLSAVVRNTSYEEVSSRLKKAEL